MATEITGRFIVKTLWYAVLLSLVNATLWLFLYSGVIYCLFHIISYPGPGDFESVEQWFLGWIMYGWIAWLLLKYFVGRIYGSYSRVGLTISLILFVPIMILLWVFFGMDLLKDQSKAVCIYLGLYNSNSSDIRTLVNSTTNIYDGGIMQFFISCFISGIICFYLSIRKRETHMSLLLLGIITSMPYQLYAYDTNITHQNITAGAITLLNLKSSATYFELLTEEEQIKQGSTW